MLFDQAIARTGAITGNATAGIIDLFEQQVIATPDRTAIVFESCELTYEQLNSSANRIAHYLRSLETKAEQCIGICLDRSPDAIIAMIGIMKAGAAFVPLDPEFPLDRLAFIVEDAGIASVICDRKYSALFADTPIEQCVEIGTELPCSSYFDEFDDSNCGNFVAPHQLAYVMYTSGSTGKPKGVQIEHGALTTYCNADIDVYALVEADRTLQFSTLNFDIAIEEIFPPLLTGGAVVVRPRDRAESQNELSAIVESADVTAIHLATAYWHEWVDLMRATGARVPKSLRLMVVTGEKVSAEHYRRWLTLCDHDVLWCNAYGPTEATVSATVFTPSKDWIGENMPIGKPLLGYEALILDSAGNRLGEGETGELFIGGPALARGYLNRPNLTAEAFVTRTIGDNPPVRLYKSGDLARWLPNGDIEFAGRIDHQIKLGSYRIEPGEIESAINQHDLVRESLVIHEAIEGDKYLIAYVARGSDEIEPPELADFLKSRLPIYMLPTRYVMCSSFPKTINGKIDRKSLPSPDTSCHARRFAATAPRNELENLLCEIWSEVLNIGEIGIHDDFFALGGSSLLVTRVITRIQSHLSQEIPVRDFFANPTVASIASHIASINDGSGVEAAARDRQALRDRLPEMEPCFIENSGQRLFAVHYRPRQQNSTTQAILICPPLGHEYQRSHRNLQQLAVLLAQAGHHVLRIDYTATGNSSGEHANGVEDWQSDIRAAAAWIRNRTGPVALSVIGLRLGAALVASSGLSDVDTMVSWDPTDGQQQVALLQRFHERTLTNFHRFNVRQRQAESGQLFGMALDQSLEASIASLPYEPLHATAERTIEIRSQSDYLQPSNNPGVDVVHAADAIYWDDAAYSDSAFSSPNSFRAILDLFKV